MKWLAGMIRNCPGWPRGPSGAAYDAGSEQLFRAPSPRVRPPARGFLFDLVVTTCNTIFVVVFNHCYSEYGTKAELQQCAWRFIDTCKNHGQLPEGSPDNADLPLRDLPMPFSRVSPAHAEFRSRTNTCTACMSRMRFVAGRVLKTRPTWLRWPSDMPRAAEIAVPRPPSAGQLPVHCEALNVLALGLISAWGRKHAGAGTCSFHRQHSGVPVAPLNLPGSHQRPPRAQNTFHQRPHSAAT